MVGKLTAAQYADMATAIVNRGTRPMANIAAEFGVSREYVRQVNAKFGLPPGHVVSRKKRGLKEAHHSEWLAYANAKQRCVNPKRPTYKDYGGRGILFLFKNFREFIEHIKPKPWPGLTLDRIDNNGHYEIGNVRWTTQKQQCSTGHRRAKKSSVKLALST
jgi:hypothetical protein